MSFSHFRGEILLRETEYKDSTVRKPLVKAQDSRQK